jgi:hypothetical protein
MTRHLVNAPDGTDAHHAMEHEHITDIKHAMTADHTEVATEPRNPVGAVFAVVSCRPEFQM